MDCAVKAVSKERLKSEDQVWLVMDVDRWTHSHLKDIAELCQQQKNTFWKTAISNPCFEIWLLLHYIDLNSLNSIMQKNFKQQLSQKAL